MALLLRKIAGYGWRPDTPDHRDRRFAARVSAPAQLPAAVTLRQHMPPVYDQGQLGSCTGNAIAGLDEYVATRQQEDFGTPSRLFIYYGERVIENTVSQDAGAEIRDGMKVLATLGAPPETDWPYDISQFATTPPEVAFTEAKKHEASEYLAVDQTLDALREALASGYPVVFGFSVYQSFESPEVARSGRVPMPAPSETLLGGHAVVIIGYDDARQLFEVRNSWGPNWGDAGYFWMPYTYVVDPNLASDFWTLHRLS